MKIGQVFGLHNAINEILQEELAPRTVLKLNRVLTKIQPEIESTQKTLRKILEDNEDNPQRDELVKNADSKLSKDESEVQVEKHIDISELPSKVKGTTMVGLLPIIIEEDI